MFTKPLVTIELDEYTDLKKKESESQKIVEGISEEELSKVFSILLWSVAQNRGLDPGIERIKRELKINVIHRNNIDSEGHSNFKFIKLPNEPK